MSNISEYMTQDHRDCDHQYADMEKAVIAGDFPQAQKQWEKFNQMMERHLGMEEQLLFPEFEGATGNTMGPTQMMRMEHHQMREMIALIHDGIAAGDKDKVFGYLETLMILLQQHNMKEEQILYPMMQNALGSDDEAVMDRLKEFST